MKEREEERGRIFELVVINPSMVFGPPLFLPPKISESLQIIHDFLANKVLSSDHLIDTIRLYFFYFFFSL